jgi:hypothetical protein
MMTATNALFKKRRGPHFALGSVSAFPEPSLPDFAPHPRPSAAH